MPGEIKDEVERGAPAVAVGVVEIAALEDDGAKKCVDGDGAVVADGFAGKRRGVVGDELAVVEQFLDDVPGVAGKGVAQSGLEPLGQVLLFLLLGESLARLGEVEFCFAVFFCEALGLEVFFSAIAPAAVSAARRAMVCSKLSWASCAVS